MSAKAKDIGLKHIMKLNINTCHDEHLSEETRHRILSFMIENEIISIHRAISFIEWLISRNSSRNLAQARDKWRNDVKYLQNYEPAEGIINVKEFRKKEIRRKESGESIWMFDGFDDELPFT